jgi:hypothetical protein
VKDICPKCGKDRNFVHDRDGSQMCWCVDEVHAAQRVLADLDDVQLSSEEAEKQLRALIATTGGIHDAKLDAFKARLPKMRMSDLIGYYIDPETLARELGLKVGVKLEDPVHAGRVSIAAVLAIKDEIDRRFPNPGGTTP